MISHWPITGLPPGTQLLTLDLTDLEILLTLLRTCYQYPPQLILLVISCIPGRKGFGPIFSGC